MRFNLAVLGTAMFLSPAAALSQAASHEGHAERKVEHASTTPAFRGYRAWRADEPLVGWREANDRVRDAGGHAGIMKDAARKGQAPGPK